MSSNLIFVLFIVGLPLAMMFMHRGGHAHGGSGGGCGGGHGHGHTDGHGDHDVTPDVAAPGQQVKTPLLGPPGAASNLPPAAAEEPKHRSC